MNHKALAIASVVAVATLVGTAVGFAIPQAVFAGGYGHHHHHQYKNNNHRNDLRVDQQVNQQNSCTSGQSNDMRGPDSAALVNNSSSDIASNGIPNNDNSVSSGAICINSGNNEASIHR